MIDLSIEKKHESCLQYHTIRLTDIAQLVGFEEQSYFSRVFKRMVGMSPRRYREEHCKSGGLLQTSALETAHSSMDVPLDGKTSPDRPKNDE